MDTAYNTYGNNAMGMGLADAGLNNTVQMEANQSVNNVISITDRIGINMVDRDVERSLGGDTRSSATKKAKFTPSSKSNIEGKYLDYVKNNRQNNAKKVTDNVVSIDEYRKPIATESVYSNVPSATCQRLSERIDPKTNQLERTITLHASIIGMNKHIFANSCKPIKVNNRSITNCKLNSENLEKYYGKPVESIQTNRNNDIDVASVDKKEVTESVNDAFKMPTMPLNDTFQLPSMELNEGTGKTIVKPSSDVLSDMEMTQPIELPDKKLNVTSEYNVDSLFKKDIDTTDFQLPSVDSLKMDSIDVVSDTSYNEVARTEKNDSEIEISKENIRSYISNANSKEGLEKIRAVLDDALKTSHNLANVLSTKETELVDAEKQKEQLNKENEQLDKQNEQVFARLVANCEDIMKRNKEMQEKYEQVEETLSMNRQDIEEGLKRREEQLKYREEIQGLVDMVGSNIPNNVSVSRGRRGKAA